MEAHQIAFGLDQTNQSTLAVYTTGTHRAARTGKPDENSLGPLELLNERGLDTAAGMIGMYVLAMLNLWHPEVFKQYPALRVEIPPPPALPAATDE